MNLNKEELLEGMREDIGEKSPVDFFAKLVDAFDLLFSKIEQLELEVKKVKTNSALAINWDPKVASQLIAKEIEKLREHKDKSLYTAELSELKRAYGRTFLDYNAFVTFWVDVLGYHPFMDYE